MYDNVKLELIALTNRVEVKRREARDLIAQIEKRGVKIFVI